MASPTPASATTRRMKPTRRRVRSSSASGRASCNGEPLAERHREHSTCVSPRSASREEAALLSVGDLQCLGGDGELLLERREADDATLPVDDLDGDADVVHGRQILRSQEVAQRGRLNGGRPPLECRVDLRAQLVPDDDVRDRPTREERPPPPRPRRQVPGVCGGSRCSQHVADAAHRVDEPRLAAGLGLAAQVSDVHLEGVRRRVRSRSPKPGRRSATASAPGASCAGRARAGGTRCGSARSRARRVAPRARPGRARGRRSAAPDRRSPGAPVRRSNARRRASSSSSAKGLTR